MEYQAAPLDNLIANKDIAYIRDIYSEDEHLHYYTLCVGDVIEYTFDEFLKPMNLNMLMQNNFEIIGYGEHKDYWVIKLFGKTKIIHKPFTKIKTVKLVYKGKDAE